MHRQAMDRLHIETELHRALHDGQFALHYQPVLAFDTGQVCCVEALIRWDHPKRGLLAPAGFLDVAQESGLILPVSDWVVRTACREVKRIESELGSPLRVSVNVPSQQLQEPGFIDLIRDALARSGLAATSLGIELVESTLIENRETTVAVLQQLQRMGVTIAVDDFGTGYSSLSYLKRFPLNGVKIDRSFIQGVPDDANDTAISNAIIAMAKNLNLNVVAEGVETREQAEFLQRHGCNALQGYWFSRPLPLEACIEFLKHHAAKRLGSVA
jgi:EAL domain-containing protein (putative c-di-GMP-specific phosphodiesterase class I)